MNRVGSIALLVSLAGCHALFSYEPAVRTGTDASPSDAAPAGPDVSGPDVSGPDAIIDSTLADASRPETNLQWTYQEIIGTGQARHIDGPAAEAAFENPHDMVFYEEKVYAADTTNDAVRVIEGGRDNWTVSTADISDLREPSALLVDGAGRFYIAEKSRNQIIRWTPGDADPVVIVDDSAELDTPIGLAFDLDGTILVADANNNAIRRIDLVAENVSTVVEDAILSIPHTMLATSDGIFVTTLAGHQVLLFRQARLDVYAGQEGMAEVLDGPRLSARFNAPAGMVRLPDGRLLVADSDGGCIRVIDDDEVSTLPLADILQGPDGLLYVPARAPDLEAMLFISEWNANWIRVVYF